MSNNNIFIIHTVFQKLAAEVIVENFIPDNFNNIAIIILDGDFDTNLKSQKWSEVMKIDGKDIITWTGFTPLRVKKIYNDIQSIFSDYNLFVSNVNYPISNTFYKNSLKKNMNIHGFPEGIANLVDADVNVKRKFKQGLKFMLGLLQLNTFYIYGNKYWGDRLTTKFGTKQIMGEFKLDKKEKSKKYLYLGGMQTNGNNIRKLCKKLKIQENNLEVKLHPRSNDKINDFNIIESKISAEELFLEKNYAVVIGEGSSALYHIKCISPQTEVICFRFDNDKNERINNVNKLFEEVNIKLVFI